MGENILILSIPTSSYMPYHHVLGYSFVTTQCFPFHRVLGYSFVINELLWHQWKLHSTERVPIDGFSSFIETSIEVCPPLYVGVIYISLEENVPRSTSTSPLKFHEVNPRERGEEEVHLPELHFLVGSLNMTECNIK